MFLLALIVNLSLDMLVRNTMRVQRYSAVDVASDEMKKSVMEARKRICEWLTHCKQPNNQQICQAISTNEIWKYNTPGGRSPL